MPLSLGQLRCASLNVALTWQAQQAVAWPLMPADPAEAVKVPLQPWGLEEQFGKAPGDL